MDALIGFTGKDYAIMAADATQARSIVVFKTDQDKIMDVDGKKLLGCAGPAGDRSHFCEYVQKNVHLYTLRNGVNMSTKAMANWTRNELAYALRRGPYQVNLLIAGHDEGAGPSLYYCDYLGSMHKMDKAAHGHAAFFVLSTMDRYWKKGMSLEEGIELMQRCIKELSTRYLIHQPNWTVKVVDKDGTRVIDLNGEN